jgi:hypothetical protein
MNPPGSASVKGLALFNALKYLSQSTNDVCVTRCFVFINLLQKLQKYLCAVIIHLKRKNLPKEALKSFSWSGNFNKCFFFLRGDLTNEMHL